jgi:hypothetical protein
VNPPIHLGPANPNRVGTDAPGELLWWARALDATPAELRAVVGKVGADLQAVVRELVARIARRPLARSSPKRGLPRMHHGD